MQQLHLFAEVSFSAAQLSCRTLGLGYLVAEQIVVIVKGLAAGGAGLKAVEIAEDSVGP
ncbi:MAG: hypothetical protein WD602_08410 [Actinomycetota bacterium]